MKRLIFSLFLFCACQTIFAQKNFYGVGASYSFAQIVPEDLVGLTSLSLTYERQFSPKWSYSVNLIGQKSKAIAGVKKTFLTNMPFDTKTTHRLLGIEPLIIFHPYGVEKGAYVGIGFNAKVYNSIVKTTQPNIPRPDLFEVENFERSAVFSLGYNKPYDNGFRLNPFLNFAISSEEYNEVPIEVRIGCNFMFNGNFIKSLKQK